MSYLTHESLMPHGKYEGIKMKDLPATYLLYIYEKNMCFREVKQYVIEHKKMLTQKLEKE